MVYCLGHHGHQKKLINRPTILIHASSELAYLCNVWTGVEGHYMYVCCCPILITWEHFLERHFCLCIWDTRQYQNFEITGINPTPQTIIMPKIKKFLPLVKELIMKIAMFVYVICLLKVAICMCKSPTWFWLYLRVSKHLRIVSGWVFQQKIN